MISLSCSQAFYLFNVRRAIEHGLLVVLAFLLIPLTQANTLGYTYDEAGNVKTIRQIADRQLVLSSFTPASGTAGTDVTLIGSGFNPNAALNTVRFNGVTATVMTASLTRLIARVPAGASSGLISVTVGSSTVTSATPFTVLGSLPPPTITSFSPTIGAAGTVITVRGMNFNPTPGATQVQLNQSPVTLREVDQTNLTAVVPANTGSGKLRVTTPAGSAESAEDFIVPPGNLSATDIIARARVSVGGSASLAINQAGKHGVMLFDGTAGSYLTVDFTSFSASTVSYRLYQPNQAQLSAGVVNASNRSIHLPPLPQNGSYTLVLSPGASTANVTVRLSENRSIAVDGVSLSDNISFAGQSLRWLFNAEAGYHLSLGLSGISLTRSVVLYAFTADGQRIGIGACLPSGCALDYENLPVTGLYTVLVVPVDATTGTLTATLSKDIEALLQPGVLLDLALLRHGQKARLSFDEAAQQSPLIRLSNIAVIGTTEAGEAKLRNPDGSLLTLFPFRHGIDIARNLFGLPQSGTHTLLIKPHPQSTRTTMRVALQSSVPLSVDDEPRAVELAAGESGRFTFVAAAGDHVGLGIDNLVTSSSHLEIGVYRPDGGPLTGFSCRVTTRGCGAPLNNLSAGIYTIIITNPVASASASFALLLSSEVTGELVADEPLALSIARRGQRARLTFPGTLGQSVGMGLAAISTMPADRQVILSIYKPSGELWLRIPSHLISPRAFYWALPLLTVDGTHSVLVEPQDAATADLLITLKAGQEIVVDGDPAYAEVLIEGDVSRFTFTAQAGDYLGLAVTDLNFVPRNGCILAVIQPNGGDWMRTSCGSAPEGHAINLENLAAGTHSIVIIPLDYSTGSAVLLLTRDQVDTLPLATDYPVTLERPGQNLRLNFTASPGANMRLSLTGISLSHGLYGFAHVYDSRGRGVTELRFFHGPGGHVDFRLPEDAGSNFHIIVDPPGSATASMTIRIEPR